jgi:C4-type Zn-finger protein
MNKNIITLPNIDSDICPTCDSTNWTVLESTFEGELVIQDCSCECGSNWIDVFRLVKREVIG